MIAGALALVVAAFRAWRDEYRRAESSEEESRRLRSAADEVPIRELPDDLYWFLVIAQKNGMRRQFHVNFNSTQQGNSLFVGETPIYHTENCLWFYHLMTHAERRGLFKQESGPGGITLYRLTPEAVTILEVERKRRRVARPPSGPLLNGLTGEPVTIPLPG
ncbi:MAG: hypothetical protein WEB59_06265 [Thermoanaerobaculia bacterium]